jgi:hypothetical protein
VPFHRNSLILLGKLPLRQIVIKLLKWLLTEGLWVELFSNQFAKVLANIQR